MAGPPLDARTIADERAAVLGRRDLTGRQLAEQLAAQADGWFRRLGRALPRSWALVATGGYARGALCPGSDIDVVLLHPKRARADEVRAVAESFWYPIWDAGLKLSPSVHTSASLLDLAGDDVVTATALLELRHLAGDDAPTRAVRVGALEQWRTRPLRSLARLRDVTEERWARYGEVSTRLEPDLKDGRGGLRDVDVFNWALATDLTGVVSVLDGALDGVRRAAELLLAARCELHRLTGRPGNLLLLQDQDALAERAGYADADALMRAVSTAAREIDWVSGRFWHRVDRGVSGLDRVRRSRQLPEPIPGAVLSEDEVDVLSEADFTDQSLVFRVAAAAARLRVPLSRAALDTLAARTPPSSGPWTDRTRSAFVSLLGAGESMVPVIESLDHVGLLSRYLPQWRHVRSLPQRNAFHTYTVDRHLLVTVANATSLVRTVHRPDLLLVGALLHDIGKGQPGDHTEAGMKLVAEIAPHIGFPPDDVATLTAMVEHHLLLAETATRRDLSDPKTAANVATAIGDPTRLELLRALTEADSLATGPAAWSEWKRTLVDALVERVAAELGGRPDRGDGVDVERRFAEPLEQVRLGGGVWAEHVAAGEYEQFRIATKDRPGLFAQAAGVLALNRADVFGAEAWTSDDGIAIAQFDILPTGGEPLSFERVQHDLVEAIAGRLDVAARVAARIESAASAHRRAVAAAAPTTEVFVSNQASDSTTLIDVRVPDAPGVLYRLSAALADFGVTIRSAKVATLGHEVVDVFYVQRKGRTPRQLTSGEADEVRTVLLAAITPGGTRPDVR